MMSSSFVNCNVTRAWESALEGRYSGSCRLTADRTGFMGHAMSDGCPFWKLAQ
jgi:hypothetical protein